jgi:hypothetical protein
MAIKPGDVFGRLIDSDGHFEAGNLHWVVRRKKRRKKDNPKRRLL